MDDTPNQKLKISFLLARADLSGGVRVIATYADLLRKLGHEVLVVSRPARPPTLRERLRHSIRGTPIPADARPEPNHIDYRGVPHRVIDAHRPIFASDLPDADVVIATWWETAEWAADLPPQKGSGVFFIQHYEAHQSIPTDRVDAAWRLPMRKIVIAQWLAELARTRFGDASSLLVPNSVDLEQFALPPRGKQPVPTVGLMYSTAAFKGCDISLRAVELARKTIPQLRLVAFGSTDPTPDLPLPENTLFVRQPAQEFLKHLYGQCDAWLFGSRSEGFGLPLLEAMASRTPVIATRAGAAPELLGGEQEGLGWLVPLQDSAAMAERIVQVCRMSDPQWRSMSDNVCRAVRRYTQQDAVTRFESALFGVVRDASDRRVREAA
ncbi:MAG TPA: glycosyltransferase family 4 protein [Tepidisphaeraceae bacterium]|jgi:glycosyltransferase involved in cell wall biosynthesis|nr:glycosyltransferase family 4 protein [Tepidisphaeraceae bacterium]